MAPADEPKLLCSGLPVLVLGLAREGTAVARFLAECGADVTATDIKRADELAGAVASLEGLPIRFALGGHPLELLKGVEVVFVSPGIPAQNPLLIEAAHRGLPLSSETRLFARLCPAPVAGITGSSGKTTTTALVGEMLRAAGRKTWVGGNIGQPLLPSLRDIAASDAVVLELSSFQLESLGPWEAPAQGTESRSESGRRVPGAVFEPGGWSPRVAAILNITPNHLDRHPGMQAYISAKAHILAYQGRGDTAVLGWDNPETRRLGRSALLRGRVLWFSLEELSGDGASLKCGCLVVRLGGREEVVCRAADLRLLGRHNVANVLAACAVAGACGVPVEAMGEVATSFQGVEHRLEAVRTLRGVRWYNDSIATSPERTMAALLSFESPIVLLAGGRDKHLPWGDMVTLSCRKAKHVVLFGEAASLIEREFGARPQPESCGCRIHRADGLPDAVDVAAKVARAGDVVLLSPGCASFDAYPDFAARGEHFRRLVRALE